MKSQLKKIIPPRVGKLIKSSWLEVRRFYYTGNRYECPVCGHHFRKMLSGGFDLPVLKEKQIVGGGYRENDVCPYCLSTDRDRLIYLYLKYESDFFNQPQTVLHIAPEPALFRIFNKLDNLHYFPATKYTEGLYYGSGIQTADLLDLQFETGTFDWVICNHVLEHIPNDQLAMQEIFRVLKPWGQAILQVPYSPILKKTFEDPTITSRADREKYFGQFDHVRIYGTDYTSRLESAGFHVETIEQTKKYKTLGNLEKYALNPKEKLFVCKKIENFKSL